MNKLPAFYITRSFITVFPRDHHLSLPWARLIHSFLSHPSSWGSLHRIKGTVQVHGIRECFETYQHFRVRSCNRLVNSPDWRSTPCCPSGTVDSIYSQLPSILETVSPSATWRHAISWWQGPTCSVYMGLENVKVGVAMNLSRFVLIPIRIS